MGIRLHRTIPCGLLAGALLIALASPATAAPVPVASRGADVQVARAGSFVVADFPAGFAQSTATPSSSADNIKLARGVPGCTPYVALQKLTDAQPQATSPDFKDDSRTVSNEVDVFKSDRAASDALALFAKPSMVSCLQQLFKKQIAQDPATKGKVESVSITLDRQDIAGLGDDSVVYEGNMVLTGTDGSSTKVGVGNAAVRVGRAVDDVTYLTTNADLTEILTPAIDGSVARLRAALAGSAAPS
jgi:hypothetical protein